MERKKKIGITLAIIIFLVISGIAGAVYISARIKTEIGSLLGNASSYKEIDVDLFRQNIHIKDLNLILPGKYLSTPQLSLKGLSYYQYIKNDKLAFAAIELDSPQFTVRPSKENKPQEKKSFNKEVQIKNFRITDGIFKLQKSESSKNEIFFRFPDFEISGIRIDSTTLSKPVPFSYDSYALKGDSLRINMNPEHFLAAKSLNVNNGNMTVKDFRIIPYYDPARFDQKIPYEKDRISLRVNELRLDSLSFEMKHDTLFLKNPVLVVSGGDLEIYRNKTLPDDPRTKALYSKMLRESPVKLDFKKVSVQKSKIVYEEKVKTDRPAARISFNDVQGNIENLLNTGLNRKEFPRTKIEARALFMGKTPVNIDWSFKVTNKNDKFLISGNFGTLTGETMNPFLKPSMGIEAEGSLNSVAFTFTGNDEILKGDVLVNYEQFKIDIMKDNGQKKSKILSALANLFVDNDGLSKENSRKEIEVSRDKKKTFWNFVWLGLKQGVIEALVQVK